MQKYFLLHISKLTYQFNVWVSFHWILLPQSKDTHVRRIQDAKLALGMNVCPPFVLGVLRYAPAPP